MLNYSAKGYVFRGQGQFAFLFAPCAVKQEFSRIPPNSLIPSQIEFRLN